MLNGGGMSTENWYLSTLKYTQLEVKVQLLKQYLKVL